MRVLIICALTRFAGAWRRSGCAALAVLTGCMLCATVAAARVDLQSRTDALQDAVSQTPVVLRTVNAVADYPLFAASSPDPSAAITRETGLFYDVVAPSLPVQAPAQAWADLASPPTALQNPPASAIPSRGTGPEITLDYRQNLPVHSRLIAGHWPDNAIIARDGTTTLEVAMTAPTLARLSARLGSVLLVGGARLEVVGILAPTDPNAAFWQSRSILAAPVLDIPGVSPPYWDTAALIGPGEINVLPSLFEIGDLEIGWTVPLAATGYTPDGLSALAYALTAGLSADALTLYHTGTDTDTNMGNALGIGLQLSSGFATTVERFIQGQNAEEIETAIPTTSLTVIGLIALALLSRVSVDRREPESKLLAARGAPLRALVGRTMADSVLTMLPILAAAIAVRLLAPGIVPAGLWWRLVLIGAASVLAPSAFTLGRHGPALLRRVRPGQGEGGPGGGLKRRGRRQRRGYATARRAVVTAAAAALCIAGLDQAHASGLAAGGGVDFYTACAPLLASTLATIVTLALGPPVLRLLLRWSRRGRGAILLLGLGRIARTPAPAAVTVFILTLALSTADLTLALHRTPVGAATQTSATQPLAQPVASYLAALAAAALAAGCLIVALAAFGEAAQRRASTARLTVTGMTAEQGRGVMLVELAAPILLAVIGGTLTAFALPWAVRPALAEVLGGSGTRLTPATFAVPVSTLVPLALAAGLLGAALARRGAAGALRLGDQAQGD